jgi:hypothetical protein
LACLPHAVGRPVPGFKCITGSRRLLVSFRKLESDWHIVRQQINEALTITTAPEERRDLEKGLLLVDMEHTVNLIDQASTFEILNKNLDTRGRMLEKAAKDLKMIFRKDRKGTIGSLARVWMGLALAEMDDADEAQALFQAAAADRTPRAAEARRLARYFHFLLPVISVARVKLTRVERRAIAEQWLMDYPDNEKTFEGRHVRLELGHLYRADGELQKSLALYRSLAEEESPFKDAATAETTRPPKE